MKNFLRHATSLAAPILMCFVIPGVILWGESEGFSLPVFNPVPGFAIAGAAISLAGLVLLVMTIRMFIRIGQGTIMPWDPTRKLITSSLYSHVRNPMILGVLLVEVGEAFLFASDGIATLAMVFFMVNTLYFIAYEEPGLEKRFGAEYQEYKRNVPRWIPRISPWIPDTSNPHSAR